MSIAQWNQIPTFRQVSNAQRVKRAELTADAGESFESAYREAVELFNAMPDVLIDTPAVEEFTAQKNKYIVELPVTPRKSCLVHREKVWASPSGNHYACCQADFCSWGQLSTATGKRRTRHSDGQDHSFDIDDMPTVEPNEDETGVVEVPEVRVAQDRIPVPVAGQDEPEDAVVADVFDDAVQRDDEQDEQDEVENGEGQDGNDVN